MVRALGRQACEHVLEVDIRIVPIELCRTDQAHDRYSPLSRPQRTCKQPVRAVDSPPPDLIFHPIVIHGNVTVVQVARERRPSLETVVERLPDRRAVRHAFSLNDHPPVQRISNRLATLLSHDEPLLWRRVSNLALDVVRHAKEFQGLLGDLAFAGGVQIEEFPACVRHAPDFGHPEVESCLVAAVVVADQLALPGAEEGARMFAGAAAGEVVDDRAQGRELRRCIGPQVGAMRLSLARTEHLHRRFIGMQHRLLQHLFVQRIDDGLQVHPAHAHPRAQRRLRDRESGPGKDALLPIQGQMISVFGNQDISQQCRSRHALVDHLRRHGSLYQRLAGIANPFAANMALDREHARRVVELLADVLADAHAQTVAGTSQVLGLVMDLGARQMRWQRGALWLLTGLALWRDILQRLEFGFDCRQIGVDTFFEQACLPGMELFAASAVSKALEQCDLMGDLVDVRLPQMQFPIPFVDLLDQFGGQRAQLFCAEGVERIEVCDTGHETEFARTGFGWKQQLFTYKRRCVGRTLHYRNDVIVSQRLPRQSDNQRMQLLGIEGHDHGTLAIGPDKAPLVQTARGKPDAEAVVDQHLHARGTAVGEQVGMMRPGRTEFSDHVRQCRVGAGP